MSRIALINMFLGFMLLFVAACGGAFVASGMTDAFLSKSLEPQWVMVLQATSHGHTSLFGIIHVLMGLTLPYTRSSRTENILKTFGVFAGSFAMGPLMLIRAALGPSKSTEPNGIIIGVFLGLALLAIGFHCGGLAYRIKQRN